MKQLRLMLMLLALSAVSPAVAQVWTLEVSGLSTDTSIVKCYGSKMFVYNHAWGDKGFLLLDEYTTSTDKMNYNSIDSVADMKIEGNTVYFCGRMDNGSVLIGFVGYFDITSYPNATATVYQLPQFSCINKLVYTTFSNQYFSNYHLMMIGTKASGLTSLIDVALTPTWSFAVHDSDDDIFLDVDQTRDYVIVTSRHDKSDGHVWTFFKTSPTGNYFFDSPNTQRAPNPSPYPYPYLIESVKNLNRYVVTSRPDASGPFYFTVFNGPGSVYTYKPANSGHVVRNLSYNTTGNILDIVVDIVSTGHSILRIPPLFYPVGGVFTKVFSNHIPVFHSIDSRPVGTSWCAVSGRSKSSNLGLFLYDPLGGEDCSTYYESLCSMSNEKWLFDEIRLCYYSISPTNVTLEPNGKNYPVKCKCVSKTETEKQ